MAKRKPSSRPKKDKNVVTIVAPPIQHVSRWRFTKADETSVVVETERLMPAKEQVEKKVKLRDFVKAEYESPSGWRNCSTYWLPWRVDNSLPVREL